LTRYQSCIQQNKKQSLVSKDDNQLDKLTLILQGLTGVIETKPESAYLYLTAIPDVVKSLKVVRTRVKMPTIYAMMETGNILGPTATGSIKTVLGVLAPQRGRWLVIEYLTGIRAQLIRPEYDHL
jgi:hypothetical protein